MAIAFDAESVLVVGTGDRTQSHNPVGTPRGVLVIVVHEVGTDTVAGVTYDGTALVEVPLSPLLHTTPETGSVHAFFLGVSVPTADPATWAVDVTDTSDYIAACFTVTAAMDTEVHDTSTFDSGATTAPSATLTITKNSFVAGGLYSGLAAPGATEVAGTAEVVTGDLGADSGEISRGDSIKTADFAYGWTQASDDGAVLAIAISESANVSVNAGNAAGTGTANQPSVGVSPAAGLAAGTGTANDATVAFSKDVDAGLASGTGTANQPAAGVDVPAGNAAGSGAALQPGAGVSPAAGLAAGTGVANDATVQISGGGPAWHAWSTTFSNPVSAFTNVDAGLASGTGTAFNAAVALDANAAAALAIATAYDPSVGVAVGAGLAEGSGTAYNATVQITQGAVNAYAGLAEGFGTAWDATVETTGRGGHPGRGIVRRRAVVPQPVLVTGELVIRIPAPQFAMTGSVNDDEVVLELLFLDL